MTSDSSVTLGTMAFQTLLIAAGTTFLLPNLTHLSWFPPDDTFPFIHFFLGPHIEKLSWSLYRHPQLRLSLLATLNVRYPSLTYLDLRHISTSSRTAVYEAICGWNCLRHLSVDTLSPVALRHVATLPTLERLSLSNISDTEWDLQPSHSSSYFPSLKMLDVCSQTISPVILLAKVACGPFLDVVEVIITDLPTLSQWEDLLEAVQDYWRYFSLTFISIMTSALSSPGIERHQTIRSNHLRCLSAFSHLTTVDFFPRYKIELNDDVVRTMAQAWPRIRDLHLADTMTTHPDVSLSALIDFARYCPELKALTILLDARRIPRLSSDERVYSKALTMLDIENWPVLEPELVAEFLLNVFPKLSGASSGNTPRVGDEGWMQVQRLIQDHHREATAEN
jgi:hypothetical protein